MSYFLANWPLLRKTLCALRLIRNVRVGYCFGRKMYIPPDGPGTHWHWVDTGKQKGWDEPITWPCPKCGELPTPEGHDPCIKNLPGVVFACCGHGVDRGYVYFADGAVIRGDFSVERKLHVYDQMDRCLLSGETSDPYFEHVVKVSQAFAAWEQEISR